MLRDRGLRQAFVIPPLNCDLEVQLSLELALLHPACDDADLHIGQQERRKARHSDELHSGAGGGGAHARGDTIARIGLEIREALTTASGHGFEL